MASRGWWQAAALASIVLATPVARGQSEGEAPPTDAPTPDAPTPDPPPSCPPGTYCEQVEVEPPDLPLPDEDELAAPEPTPQPPTRVTPVSDVGEPIDVQGIDWDAEPTPAEKSRSLGDRVATAGAIVFALGYLPALAVGVVAAVAEDGDDADQTDAEEYLPLLIPAVGPPITGALLHASPELWGVLGADAAIQVIGLALLGIGLGIDDDDGSARAWPLPIAFGDGRHSFGAGLRMRY